ncbi:MAG: hypothetical protein IJE64_10555, partial [Methanobrevibacter sp.]|nr:hypothetical protein [Methanobrevibacter sp.]
MNKNRLIIIGLVIVIIALLVGIAISVLAPAKEDVKLTIINNDTIFEGDSIKVKLTDVNDTRIANETVNITITDENSTTNNYSVVTNENGTGVLKLNKSAGNYTINCTFSGNENYTGNSTFQMLKIIKQINQ